MTFVGRGNVALAVILTALSSIVTVFTIPIVLSWAVPWFPVGRRADGAPSRSARYDAPACIDHLAADRGRHGPQTLRRHRRRAARALAAADRLRDRPRRDRLFGDRRGRMVLDNLLGATPAIYALNLVAIGIGCCSARRSAPARETR